MKSLDKRLEILETKMKVQKLPSETEKMRLLYALVLIKYVKNPDESMKAYLQPLETWKKKMGATKFHEYLKVLTSKKRSSKQSLFAAYRLAVAERKENAEKRALYQSNQ